MQTAPISEKDGRGGSETPLEKTPKDERKPICHKHRDGCAALSANLLIDKHPTQQPSPQEGPGRVHLRWGRCLAWSGLFMLSRAQRAVLPSAPWSSLLHVDGGSSHTGQHPALSDRCPGSLVWAQDLGKQWRSAKGTIMFPQHTEASEFTACALQGQ